MLTMTTLTELVNQLDEEALDYLVHGYDAYLIQCQREESTPLSMLEYFKTDEYQELVESGDIEDLREYLSDLENASLDELKDLALTFDTRVQNEIEENAKYYQTLDNLIDELEVGSLITDDEKRQFEQFLSQLRVHGYLPTADGTLKLVSPEEAEECDIWDFVWNDYLKAHQALNSDPEHTHVITITSQGRYSTATTGWMYVNRIGYILTDQPILTEGSDIVW